MDKEYEARVKEVRKTNEEPKPETDNIKKVSDQAKKKGRPKKESYGKNSY